MAQSTASQLVTANRLRDGVPVYYAGVDRWSPVIADALLVGEVEAESLLEAAQAGPAPRPVVAPYLIAAVRQDGSVKPMSLREQIRAHGPTV